MQLLHFEPGAEETDGAEEGVEYDARTIVTPGKHFYVYLQDCAPVMELRSRYVFASVTLLE